MATGAVVVYGVSATPRDSRLSSGANPVPDLGAPALTVSERPTVVSRAAGRQEVRVTRAERRLSVKATRRAVLDAEAKRWTTDLLNVWSKPGEAGRKLGLIEERTRVLVTGRSMSGRDEVVLDGRSRWVTSGYLAQEEPSEEVALGTTCSNGTSVPSGVSSNIAAVHEAVCAAFPEITTYGTLRSDGEHAQGIAVDIMVSGARGWEVAEFVRENYAELGVSYAIHARNIWSVQRAAEGWRGMEDRGSITANHFDHVHVTTF